MDVSIIIVNYNTKLLLKDCLNSIFTQTKNINFEVIVSDNGSTDGSIEMIKSDFPQVLIVENNKNIGFGAANNHALGIAKGDYIFYLNSDTVLLNNAPKIFFDFWQNYPDKKNLGAIGANLLSKENFVIHSYGHFPGWKLSICQLLEMFLINSVLSVLYILNITPHNVTYKHSSKPYFGEVDFITGADLFLRNDENAYFDERFLLYFEESDLQKKLFKLNKKRIIIDGPKIIHLCGGTIKSSLSIKRKSSFSRIQFEFSRLKFLKKHGYSYFFLLICKIIITAIWINPLLLNTTKHYIKELWRI